MDLKKFDSRFAIVPIEKIIPENDGTNTYIFNYPLGALPGQFIMIWIPGVDEKPMSVAYDNGEEFWVTTRKVGFATEKLFELKVGDKVGVRGPLGTHYEFKDGDHLALVAGGYGAAPMYFVAREAVSRGVKVDFLIGARNKDLLLYTQKVSGLQGLNLHIATDDGSVGHKGFVTEILDEVLKEGNVTKVFTCGPEMMMNAVGKVSEKHKVPAWLSMEKYMKCGIGVCGQCAVDDTGDLVCKKGPVMSFDYVKNLSDFAVYTRDAEGAKHYYNKK